MEVQPTAVEVDDGLEIGWVPAAPGAAFDGHELAVEALGAPGPR